MANMPAELFPTQANWTAWLAKHHASSTGLWLRLAKKGSRLKSVSYAEALESALRYGWIDGQKQGESADAWLQKFTPRTARSIWSKVNREKALALIANGKMKPAGKREVARAKKDGRWEQAYDSPKNAVVPPDLAAAFDANPQAKAFFAQLESYNRYAILWRVQTAKRAATRAERIARFVGMCARGEKLHVKKT
jgi:uncharacterized protein YdeI (YjbR/CyaY-like superfamily)